MESRDPLLSYSVGDGNMILGMQHVRVIRKCYTSWWHVFQIVSRDLPYCTTEEADGSAGVNKILEINNCARGISCESDPFVMG